MPNNVFGTNVTRAVGAFLIALVFAIVAKHFAFALNEIAAIAFCGFLGLFCLTTKI